MPEQVVKLEAETRGQSSKKSWFLHRAGRITASNFKAVVATNPCMPSQSLIKRFATLKLLSSRQQPPSECLHYVFIGIIIALYVSCVVNMQIIMCLQMGVHT